MRHCSCGQQIPQGWRPSTCKACHHRVRLLRAGGAGMASATFGRARLFVDQKKEASRNSCRRKDF